MNFSKADGPDWATLLELQRTLPQVIILSSDPEAALLSRPQLPIPVLISFYAFLVLPFLIPPFPLSRSLFFGVLTALLVPIFSSTTGLGQAGDYVVSIIHFRLYLYFLSFFICSPPPEENVELARPGREGCFRTWGLKGRLAAVWAMLFNGRGLGWGWELRTRGYSSAPALPRWPFVHNQLLKLGLILALVVPGHILYPTVAEVLTTPLWVQSYRCNLCILGVYCIANGSYILNSIISVSLGLSTPKEWPPLFGSITSCYSIRRAWGFWHQDLTRMVLSHASYFSRVLGVRRSHLFTVFTGFTLSGLLHAVPAWTISRSDGGMMFYFLLQAVGIGIEELIFACIGDGKLSRAFGWAWTFSWFAVTNIFFVEGLVVIGMQPIVDWRWVLGYETVRIN